MDKKQLNINNSLRHTTVVHTFWNISLYTTFKVIVDINRSCSILRIFPSYLSSLYIRKSGNSIKSALSVINALREMNILNSLMLWKANQQRI